MDVLSQLDELGPLLGGRGRRRSRPSSSTTPTPCAEFTVRGVLEHMIGGATTFAAAFRGDRARPRRTLTDVLAGFGPALTELAEAIHAPGALDRTVAGAVRRGAGRDVRPLRGARRARPRLGPRRPRPGSPTSRRTRSSPRSRRSPSEALPPLRDGDTFADAGRAARVGDADRTARRVHRTQRLIEP